MSKKKKVIWWIIAGLAVSAGAFLYFKKGDSQPEYLTEKIIRGDLKRTVSVSGKLESKGKVQLAFENGGTVKEVFVKTGDRVEAGKLLAVLDNRDLRAQLEQYQAELKIQEKALDLKRREWNDLKPEEKSSQKASVEKARAAANYYQEQLKKTFLYSPVAGVVASVDAEKGESATAKKALFTVLPGNDLEINADVPEADIAEVAVGQKADLTFDAFSNDEIFPGEVTEIYPSSNVVQDVVFYRVKIQPEKQETKFKDGMSADVDILIFEKNGVLIAPVRAVKSDNGKKYVEVLTAEKTPRKIYVETGLTGDDGTVEIKSGLDKDAEVITLTKTK